MAHISEFFPDSSHITRVKKKLKVIAFVLLTISISGFILGSTSAPLILLLLISATVFILTFFLNRAKVVIDEKFIHLKDGLGTRKIGRGELVGLKKEADKTIFISNKRKLKFYPFENSVFVELEKMLQPS